MAMSAVRDEGGRLVIDILLLLLKNTINKPGSAFRSFAYKIAIYDQNLTNRVMKIKLGESKLALR